MQTYVKFLKSHPQKKNHPSYARITHPSFPPENKRSILKIPVLTTGITLFDKISYFYRKKHEW